MEPPRKLLIFQVGTFQAQKNKKAHFEKTSISGYGTI